MYVDNMIFKWRDKIFFMIFLSLILFKNNLFRIMIFNHKIGMDCFRFLEIFLFKTHKLFHQLIFNREYIFTIKVKLCAWKHYTINAIEQINNTFKLYSVQFYNYHYLIISIFDDFKLQIKNMLLLMIWK